MEGPGDVPVKNHQQDLWLLVIEVILAWWKEQHREFLSIIGRQRIGILTHLCWPEFLKSFFAAWEGGSWAKQIQDKNN